MTLLIHATVQVSGDATRLAAFREHLNAVLAENYPDTPCAETHREDALHYDIKTTTGIPFPALVELSQEFPDLTLAVRWVNPEMGAQGAADIKAGRIETQSADPLDRSSAGRQPGFVAARSDGSLYLAFALFSVRSDGCAGYAITAEKDALFQIRIDGGKAMLYLSEADAPEWDACWECDLTGKRGYPVETWVRLPIEEDSYRKWRQYAEAFVAEWFWLEADAADITIVERQRCAEHDIPVRPANLRYEKLKAMHGREPTASGFHEVDHLGERERYALRVLTSCFAEA